MSKKNKIILLLTAEFAFIAIIFIILPSIFIKERPGVSQTSYSNTLTLDTKHSYLQQFTADKNNLRSISVQLKNPGLVSQDQVKIELLDQNQNNLRTLETSGLSIGDPSWITFEFPFVNSKVGDIFFIKITTNNTQDSNLYVYGNQIDKSINFKTIYTSTSLKESFQNNIREQLNQIKHRNILNNFIYLAIIVAINILLFLSL